ncbi:MAG: hypothetical protein PHU03_03015 [Syntrophales bacterium]|nr:hypothetical protein [Syntrophales bacterium]
MPDNGGSVRIHIVMGTETWDRLVMYIREKYGRDVKMTSIVVEEAVREFLEAHEIKNPAPANQ